MRLLTKSLCGFFMLSVLGLAIGDAVVAQDKKEKKKETKKVELKVKAGDTAPAFESVDETGKAVKSADIVGKKIVVLYFYPADFTGGCTKQACGFRDDIEKLGSKDVVVLGVSGDSVATHKLFKAHHKLPFSLLADEKGEVAKAFGVPVTVGKYKSPTIDEKGEKGSADRGAQISRYTVVIGRDGKVADISPIGDAAGDSKRVAAIVAKLAK